MLRQSLHIKQLQKLSPQQIQLVKLLQLPTMELEQRIKQELEENPALEEVSKESDSENQDSLSENTENTNDSDDFDIRDYLDENDVAEYKLHTNNYSAEHHDMPVSDSLSFTDYLLSQFRLLSSTQTEFTIGETIIGNIDESGYLQRELPAIVDDLAFSQGVSTDLKTVEQVLKKIQSLDPPGVGARNLQECLLLQLQRKNAMDIGTDYKSAPAVMQCIASLQIAQQILSRMFDAFINKRYDQISQRLHISEEQLSVAIQEITKLNPKPGNAYENAIKIGSQIVVPDFTVIPENDRFEITLNARNAPELQISKDYAELLQTYSETNQKTQSQKDAVTFVRQKIDSAKSFIESVKLRQHTLLGTMETIVNLQADYFKNGDITMLKPMKLQDVADVVGLDISTISRVVNSKYVQTPFGIFLLRDLFSNAVSNEAGNDVTSAEIKAEIKEIIENEDKRNPLNDDALTAILAEKGYSLVRRTVAKYREGLGFDVARLRKTL